MSILNEKEPSKRITEVESPIRNTGYPLDGAVLRTRYIGSDQINELLPSRRNLWVQLRCHDIKPCCHEDFYTAVLSRQEAGSA